MLLYPIYHKVFICRDSRAHSKWLDAKGSLSNLIFYIFIKRFEDNFLYFLSGSGSATFFQCSCLHGTYDLSFIIHSSNFLCFQNLCYVNSPWVKTRPGQVPRCCGWSGRRSLQLDIAFFVVVCDRSDRGIISKLLFSCVHQRYRYPGKLSEILDVRIIFDSWGESFVSRPNSAHRFSRSQNMRNARQTTSYLQWLLNWALASQSKRHGTDLHTSGSDNGS